MSLRMASSQIAPRSRDDYDHLFKLLLLGESGTGKSSLLLRYCEDTFTEIFSSTIGVDFKFRTLQRNDKRIKLQVWDTAGQERFHSIVRSFYRGSSGAVVVYDCTDRESFDKVSEWVAEFRDAVSDAEKPVVIVGAKCDLDAGCAVSAEEGDALAIRLGCKHTVASAKEDIGVAELFEMMAELCLEHARGNPLEAQPDYQSAVRQGDISLTDPNSWSARCCGY